MRQNQFGARQPDGVVKCAAASEHYYFMLRTGVVGQVPDFFRIGAGDAGSGGRGHGSGGARSHHAGFGAGKFRQAFSDSMLKLEHVHEMMRGGIHGAADFGQFERPAQIGPGAARVDEGPDTDAPVDIDGGLGAGGGASTLDDGAAGDGNQHGSGGGPFDEGAAVDGERLHFASVTRCQESVTNGPAWS